VQCPRDHAAAAAELLFDSISSPSIMEHILDVQKEKISSANAALAKDPAFIASEGVASVAYTGALARPCFWQGNPISAETLLAYHGAVRSRDLPKPANYASSCEAKNRIIVASAVNPKSELTIRGDMVGGLPIIVMVFR
jgi:hypothetical protein